MRKQRENEKMNNPSKCGCAVRGYYNEKVAKPATETSSK